MMSSNNQVVANSDGYCQYAGNLDDNVQRKAFAQTLKVALVSAYFIYFFFVAFFFVISVIYFLIYVIQF